MSTAEAITPTTWQEYEALTDLEIQVGSTDPRWVAAELVRCQQWSWADPSEGFYYWARRYWKLVDRRGQIRRLLPNAAQHHFLTHCGPENVILKPRKRGFSTIIDAMAYWRAWVRMNQVGSIVTHRSDSTAMLWNRLLFAHDQMPPWMKPKLKVSSAREVKMTHSGSHLVVFTAGGRDIGAGGDQDILHLSEFALYLDPDMVMASLVQARRHGAWLNVESTPRGFNRFHQVYQAAKSGQSGRVAFFFPWYEDPLNAVQPIEDIALTREEADLAKVHQLTPAQLLFRRQTIQDLDEATFSREYPGDDVSCFMSSTASRFNVKQLTRLLAVVKSRVKPLDLTGEGPFSGDDQGRFTCWVLPQEGHQYVLGADVAEGLPPDGDFSAAGVLDVRTCDQVAAWHGHISPGDFAHKLAAVGAWYHHATIGVERENHGHATIRALMNEAGYDPLYHHQDYDQTTGRTGWKVGWPTNSKTRPIMLSDLREALDRGHMIIRDADFISECITFGEAAEGPADRKKKALKRDRVMAWAIAWQIRNLGTPVVA